MCCPLAKETMVKISAQSDTAKVLFQPPQKRYFPEIVHILYSCTGNFTNYLPLAATGFKRSLSGSGRRPLLFPARHLPVHDIHTYIDIRRFWNLIGGAYFEIHVRSRAYYDHTFER